jgi:hypothetical protein
MRSSQPSAVKNLLKILRLSMMSLKAVKFSSFQTKLTAGPDPRVSSGSGSGRASCRT